ncbi:hypothetical protein AAFF_G00232850 [Aldrovandia affinis]|uniref:VWFD domain-containing protein n=1 Tax=Aldrovandia affinis TaxID=143900 RepID=A0AAD7W405_9TELE|nr:hypothetical protein AAFF_G00232850 [Aldrovandia affinis]
MQENAEERVMLRYLLTLCASALLGFVADDPCEVAHCDLNQSCVVKDGLPVCQPKTQLCTTWGGSHYHTFNGRAYDFYGTCNYTFARTPCHGSSISSTLFEVHIATVMATEGNATFSSFDQVHIRLQDFDLTIVKGELQQVWVNGLRYRLPFSLSSNVRLYPSGSSLVLETGSGLVLRYDWDHHLMVLVSQGLASTVCGLCGNSTPPALSANGHATLTDAEVVEFVRSWKMVGRNGELCRDNCNSSCPVCSPEQLKAAPGVKVCRLLEDPKGPFADCSKIMNPTLYVHACKADLCVQKGDHAVACRAIKAFADACQGSGIKISPWRKLANCSMVCPLNSHYEVCGSSCPATCGDPDAPSRCQSSCVETCQCDDGFLFGRQGCVRPHHCGCTHQGFYRLPNETFWDDDQCQQRCTCSPASRTVTCIQAWCPHDEKCAILDGAYGCHRGPHGLCLAQGVPHYITFDGRRFDFEGTCVYLLAARCPSTGSLPDFNIEVQNKRRGHDRESSKMVRVRVHGYRIQVSWEVQDKVLVNGLLLGLPTILSLGKVKIYKAGLSLHVECDFGLLLAYNWNNLVTLVVPRSFSGALCGICGNFNGDANDDLVPPNDFYSEYSAALTPWKTIEVDGCVDTVPRNRSQCPDRESGILSGVSHCGKLMDPTGPFRDCHGMVDPVAAFENCVNDTCLNNSSQYILCQTFARYVAACQDAGAKVHDWRSSEFCNMSCPTNSKYTLCSAPLPKACVEPPSPHGAVCREDCECIQGFFRSGNRCVLHSECGCQWDGVYHPAGETFIPKELCQEECTCEGRGRVRCQKSSCPSGTQCSIQNGTRQCYPTPGVGRCSLSGGIHYRTFDGRRYRFYGFCRYTLVQTCNGGVANGSAPAFSVLVQASRLHLEIYGTNLTLVLDQSAKVQVNGVMWNLPAYLGHINVTQHGLRTQVETDAGLALVYDTARFDFLQVIVPHIYAGRLCGLCGDFNGNLEDDLQTLDLRAFITSWEVPFLELVCVERCLNGCVPCNATEAIPFRSEEHCGLLSAPAGPFGACHSMVDPLPHFENCVHDLCVSHGDREKYCSSLRAYTLACQEAGAEVQPWRNRTHCSLICPVNSQYSVCVDACAETCADISANRTCQLSCAEGCQCGPGFRISADRCVSSEECGCFLDGRYYERGEVSWDDRCHRRCNCSATGALRCESAACPKGSRCGLFNGSTTCVGKGQDRSLSTPYSRCWVLGSFYHTFDGSDFDFQGYCNYTLAQDCDRGGTSPPFQVQRNLTKDPSSGLVAVQVSEDHIVIKRGNASFVWVNGQRRHLPLTLQEGEVVVHRIGWYTVIEATFGLSVKYDLQQNLVVLLPKNFSNVCGLCGDNNGNATDDFRTPAGDLVDKAAFGWSWRAGVGGNSCRKDCGELCQRYDLQLGFLTTYEVSLRVFLWSGSSPFVQCYAMVDPSGYHQICARNRCIKELDLQFLCQILQSYTDACQFAKVEIQSWRNSTFCPARCPKHSRYVVCGSVCPPTCADPAGVAMCTLACVETCRCDEGYVLEGDACIPAARCGCTHQGLYHRRDQAFWTDGNCTERCVCYHAFRPASCALSSCGPMANCGLLDGEWECLPYTVETCSLESGRHFHTFDRRSYRFHGSCAYQLVGLCSDEARLTPFKVEVENAGDLGSGLRVAIKVYNVSVAVSSGNDRLIQVDGLHRNMPCTVAGGKVAVHTSLLRTLVQADFGLSVVLDANERLTVMLLSKYAGVTCGLCGNYNGNPADDLKGPGGQKDLSPSELVRSWRTDDLPWCVEGCRGNCPTCTPEQREDHSKPSACGRLLNANGPFRICHGKVDPGRFYNNCISDLCIHKGLSFALCQSLANYVAACQEASVEVYNWRSSDFCNRVCSKDMVYDLCPISPHHTCPGFPVPNIALTPPGVCYENCACLPGLLLSGSLCVQPGNCGCFHQGQYLQLGEVSLTCGERCHCKARGEVACYSVFCTVDEECRVQSGRRNCYPRSHFGHCSLEGGSHYSTFDGQDFHFLGTCDYTLSQSCSPNDVPPSTVPFTVLIQNGESDQLQVRVEVYGLELMLSAKHDYKVWVNGVLESFPFSVFNLTVYRQGLYLIVQALDSVRVTFDLRNHVVVHVPETYKNGTCGLCGNYNGDSTDDLRLPNGTMTSDLTTLGAAWKHLSGGSACSDGCGENCPLCVSLLPHYASDHYCGLTISHDGAFNGCRHLVDPTSYYTNCLYDLCVSEGQVEQLCDGLQAYAVACQEAGVQVSPWRNGTKCMFQCPQFSHYTPCVNACLSLCAEVHSIVECPAGCAEGCQCDPGFLYDGNACIPPEECGCFLDGRRFQLGEARLLQNCTLKCTCGPPVVCKPYACPDSHICAVKGGVMSCHSSDPCEGKCGRGERCAERDGGAACEALRLDLCWVWGSPHFHSFSGKDFDFDGTCTYVLAASSGGRGDLTPFTVTGKNEWRRSSKASSLRVVTVTVYGYTLIMRRLVKGAVMVNGLVSPLPVSLRDWIRVDYWGDLALLQTDFGLQVLYDWKSLVLVALHQKYRGMAYGLCLYDGDHAGNGTETGASALMQWASTYAISDGDWLCCSDCELLSPNVMAGDERGYRERCAIIKDMTGPLAPCNKGVSAESFLQGCEKDLSNGAGAKGMLAQALKAYSTICEYHGFSFAPSRDLYSRVPRYATAVDDINLCGPHSHSSVCASPCRRSCDHFTSPACKEPCIQDCTCDEGYVYIGQTCVPEEQCGCLDSIGQPRQLNETFWAPENCQERCTCSPFNRTIRCVWVPCPAGQGCQVLNGVRDCHPTDPFNCTLLGGHHLLGFSGQSFEFHSGCSYTLALVKTGTSSFVHFEVGIANASSNSRLFHSLDLWVQVHGKELVIAKEMPDGLTVNGLYVALPYSFNEGQVIAYRSPASIMIQADFGLQVVLYRTGMITVAVPGAYGSVVSGMCGGLRTRSGALAKNAQEFGDSWKAGGVDCQLSGAPGLRECTADEFEIFKDCHFCQVLLDEQGPFKECNGVLDPQPYFGACLVDTCAYSGHPVALCNSITDYATACQAANRMVRQWRTDTFCGADCPQNSHYELCGPSCPSTCNDAFASAHCSSRCQEGCQCDRGFLLSDGKCVPDSDCGCQYKGQYYPHGTYYLGDWCEEKCHCGTGGSMACSPGSCGPQETCAVAGGFAECVPSEHGTCQVLGGFGYITFDGHALPHHGACTYILAQSDAPDLPRFKVLVSIDRVEDGTDDPLKAVVLIVGKGKEVEIFPRILWKVRCNQEDFTLPTDVNSCGVKAYQDGGSSVVVTDFGLQIRFRSSLYVQVAVPASYTGAISGLCGNYNGDKSDDLKLRSGEPTSSTSRFLSTWAEEVPGHLCALEASLNSGVSKPPTGDPCDLLKCMSGPFRNCCSTVDVGPYFDACVRSRGVTSRKLEALCLAMEAYAAGCQAEGIKVDAWRKTCPLVCPDRSYASGSVDLCTNTCAEMLTPGLCKRSSEGCQCNASGVFNGEECMPVSQCGCVHRGRYIKNKEYLYTKGCSKRCWCEVFGGVACEPTACSAGEQCLLRGGAWGCRSDQGVCQLLPSLALRTLDGLQLYLTPGVPYNLISLCDHNCDRWFRLVTYQGACGKPWTVNALHLQLQNANVVIQNGGAYVNGKLVSLPFNLPSGVSLSRVWERPEVRILVRKDSESETEPDPEPELELEVSMLGDVRVRPSPAYSEQLCGVCRNYNGVPSDDLPDSITPWVMKKFHGCGFGG